MELEKKMDSFIHNRRWVIIEIENENWSQNHNSDPWLDDLEQVLYTFWHPSLYGVAGGFAPGKVYVSVVIRFGPM